MPLHPRWVSKPLEVEERLYKTCQDEGEQKCHRGVALPSTKE